VTTSGRYGSRIAAIDEEIRDVLAQAEPALQPFYGMMLYHLGLDMDRPGGGKRMRPLICVLVYEALAGDPQAMLPAAAALELLHNFTLIHDDIEDHDPTRHHRPTVWSVWGVPQAINTGDGMYAASRLAVQRLRERSFPSERILDFACLIDQACVRVCEGQFLDITFEDRTDITVDRYRAMAAKKTGALIAACAVDRPFDFAIVLPLAWLFLHGIGPLIESAKLPIHSCKRHAKPSHPGTAAAPRSIRRFYNRPVVYCNPDCKSCRDQRCARPRYRVARCWHAACDRSRAGRRGHWVRSALP
jgi:hypothetical protein